MFSKGAELHWGGTQMSLCRCGRTKSWSICREDVFVSEGRFSRWDRISPLLSPLLVSVSQDLSESTHSPPSPAIISTLVHACMSTLHTYLQQNPVYWSAPSLVEHLCRDITGGEMDQDTEGRVACRVSSVLCLYVTVWYGRSLPNSDALFRGFCGWTVHRPPNLPI